MKKRLYWIAAVSMTLFFSGCTQHQTQETDIAPDEIAQAIIESQPDFPKLIRLTPEDEAFTSYLSDYYMMQKEQVADGVICYADGVEASEIAVLIMTDEKDSDTAKKALNEYRENRADAFEGYAPQQAALVKGGSAAAEGKYVALFICRDSSAAQKAFLNCLHQEETSSAASAASFAAAPSAVMAAETNFSESEDTYDPAAILQAWESEDPSLLSKKNLEIFNAAVNVIHQEINDQMTDYEKELAIHDWITGWSDFDFRVFGRSSSSSLQEDSDTPYGVFINREAMCHGYSSAFQLLMDMVHIPCITVFGTPGSNGIQHSWNMVQLDDEWYCVDTAWDDPIGGNPGHTYFNVTSKTLRSSGIHHWDETSVPEAEGAKYTFGRP